MTGRDRIQATFHCEPTDRAPWVPFTGVHVGSLIGADAEELLKSADRLVEGADAVCDRYAPDGIPVTFDLQIEAEALGCGLVWAEENPPAVSAHALENGVSLDDLRVPGPDAARLPIVLSAARRIRERHPDIALYGLVTGPFTLALHLAGTGIFMTMFDDPAAVERLMAFCSDVSTAVAGYYLDAGCDVVGVVDPMTSQIGPDQFRRFVTPRITPVFDSIRDRGGLGSFFVCGHAQQNIEAMCECRPDNVSVDENIPLDFVRDVCLARGISFGGNLPLTSVLLLGSPAECQRSAAECLETGGDRGFVLAPGCDLPYSTPPANLEAVAEVIRDPYRREVALTLAEPGAAADLLDMSEYGRSKKVIVDIITLDSEACAPCQYMVEAVRAVAPEFEGIVEWREHKIKQPESLVFMTSLMVRNVPAICIDGTITFVSRIPARDELIAAIQRRINEKFRINIQSRRATLYILGDPGDEEFAQSEHAVRQAIAELGADVHVVAVTDEEQIRSYGYVVGQAPIVILGRYQTKSTGRAPELAIVKEWLKDL